MNDQALEELLRALGESDRLDDAWAREPRSARCLRISRLEAIAADPDSQTADERAHVAACRICGPRLRAFRSLGAAVVLSADEPAGLRRSRGVGRGVGRAAPATSLRSLLVRSAAWSAVAAAACLTVLLSLDPPTATRRALGPAGRTGAVDGAIGLRVLGAPAAPHDDRCVARFQSTAEQSGVVMALVRLWDSRCQCASWQLYEWGEGNAVARLVAGRTFDVSVDVTHAEAAEQLLVLALAHSAADLPDDRAEAAALLACLDSSPLETQTPDQIAEFASAVRLCLPPGVTVVSHPFRTD